MTTDTTADAIEHPIMARSKQYTHGFHMENKSTRRHTRLFIKILEIFKDNDWEPLKTDAIYVLLKNSIGRYTPPKTSLTMRMKQMGGVVTNINSRQSGRSHLGAIWVIDNDAEAEKMLAQLIAYQEYQAAKRAKKRHQKP